MARILHYALVSLALHSVLLISLLLWPWNKKEKVPQFSVDLVSKNSSPVAVLNQRQTQTNNLRPRLNVSGNSTSFSRFIPRYKFGDTLVAPNGDTYSLNPGKDNPLAEWGSGSASAERIRDYTLFQALYKQVDGFLSYPGVLARHQIKGTVNARLVLSADGNCEWGQTQILGTEPYLKLYILDLLKKVCHTNFKKYISEREVTNADLSFRFDISESNDPEEIKKQKLIVGNVLLFYRNSQQSMMEWELGPFRGIFPVPAVYLNIPWIQENWDRLVEKKDPMNEFKKKFGDG